ncbi:hypothetical protein [Aurantibacter sp.]|uniref:hypothetical protein n=1 Tax=Aurantibacter sp. TaxID=2807103 RepID=UPI0032640B59
MKNHKLLLFLVSYLFLNSCNVSTLSKKDLQDLSKIKVSITIDDGIKENGLDQIKVLLTDGVKQIIENDIKILLNDKELELSVTQEMLLNKTSFYKAPSLIRASSYYFEIILPDKSRHPLAYIKPYNNNLCAKFNLPSHLPKNEDFILKWTDLNTPHQIELVNSPESNLNNKSLRTTFNYNGALKDTLYSSSGEYIISKSFFNDTAINSKNLAIKLNREELGMTNPLLLENSIITYTHTIEKLIRYENSQELVFSN